MRCEYGRGGHAGGDARGPSEFPWTAGVLARMASVGTDSRASRRPHRHPSSPHAGEDARGPSESSWTVGVPAHRHQAKARGCAFRGHPARSFPRPHAKPSAAGVEQPAKQVKECCPERELGVGAHPEIGASERGGTRSRPPPCAACFARSTPKGQGSPSSRSGQHSAAHSVGCSSAATDGSACRMGKGRAGCPRSQGGHPAQRHQATGRSCQATAPWPAREPQELPKLAARPRGGATSP